MSGLFCVASREAGGVFEAVAGAFTVASTIFASSAAFGFSLITHARYAFASSYSCGSFHVLRYITKLSAVALSEVKIS